MDGVEDDTISQAGVEVTLGWKLGLGNRTVSSDLVLTEDTWVEVMDDVEDDTMVVFVDAISVVVVGDDTASGDMAGE